MEVGERTKIIKRGAATVAVFAVALTMSSDNPEHHETHHISQPVAVHAIANQDRRPYRKPEVSQKALPPVTTITRPPETSTTISVHTSPTVEVLPSTTTTTVESQTIKESTLLRDWVANSLKKSPTKKLVALPVSPRLQAQYSNGLFVMDPQTNCAAVTELSQENGKIQVQNTIFGRPANITNPHTLQVEAYSNSGIIGHGDTDAAAALGENPVKLVAPNIPSVSRAITSLTAEVCNQMAPAPALHK